MRRGALTSQPKCDLARIAFAEDDLEAALGKARKAVELWRTRDVPSKELVAEVGGRALEDYVELTPGQAAADLNPAMSRFVTQATGSCT